MIEEIKLLHSFWLYHYRWIFNLELNSLIWGKVGSIWGFPSFQHPLKSRTHLGNRVDFRNYFLNIRKNHAKLSSDTTIPRISYSYINYRVKTGKIISQRTMYLWGKLHKKLLHYLHIVVQKFTIIQMCLYNIMLVDNPENSI